MGIIDLVYLCLSRTKIDATEKRNQSTMFLQEKIEDINERLKALEKFSNIVIWGAGIHTSQLFEKTEILSYNIKNIVDINELKQGENYFGFMIQNPADILWNNVDAVVISVPNKESQIEETLINNMHFSGRIVVLYGQDEHMPFYQLYDKKKTGLKFQEPGGYDKWFNILKQRLDVEKWVTNDFQYSLRQGSIVEEKKSIIKVGLLHCQVSSYNMIYSLYQAFEADSFFEPIVILQGKGYGNMYKRLEKQMKKQRMRYEFDYNCVDEKFDILIVHHVQLPPTKDVERIIHKTTLKVAVPLGVISYDGKGLNAAHLRSYQVTEVFCEKSIYDRTPDYIHKEFRCYATGNPKFDCIYQAYLHKVEIPEKFKKMKNPNIKKIILWTTDHNGVVPLCSPDVAFDLYADTVFNYIKEHKEIGLIFRPYDTYVSTLLSDGLWTQEQIDYFRAYCDESENIVWDDESDYSVSYSLADAILADAGCGIICSALPMMNPM